MMALSEMEIAVLKATAERNWPGFRVESVRVVRRDNTGAGRFTYLHDDKEQFLRDGSYSANDLSLTIPGLHFGLDFEVVATTSRLDYMEFTSCGENWSGSESGWCLTG